MDPAVRTARLRNFFLAVLDGKRVVKNKNDAGLFLDAICDQQDASTCIEKLAASSSAIQSLRLSVRSDTSSGFINAHSGGLLNYIANDGVRQLCGGSAMQDVLAAIVEPPSFWNGLVQAYHDKELSTDGIRAYANLLSELLTALSPSSLLFAHLDILAEAKFALGQRELFDSPEPDVRSITYRIQDAVRIRSNANATAELISIRPGGRHDNDPKDFRQVTILPTKDELLSNDQPYYLRADEILDLPLSERGAAHLDNQFRLLREDMLGELRNDLQLARGMKQGKRGPNRLSNLSFHGMHLGSEDRYKPPTVALRCFSGLSFLKGMKVEERKKFFEENKKLLKHDSLGCLLASGEIVAFATVDRDNELLSKSPPVILLRILDNTSMKNTLLALKTIPQERLEFLQVDTALFAYSPVLKRLQAMPSLPLADQILCDGQHSGTVSSTIALNSIARDISKLEGHNIRQALDLKKDVVLDHSQTQSLVSGLTKALSLIHGPPGTGKSFIGALLAKTLLDNTEEKILVLSFTNHALDQFLEDILKIGVKPDKMLRLGSRSTATTKPLGLYEQKFAYRRTRGSYLLMDHYSGEVDRLARDLQKRATAFKDFKVSNEELLDQLQFSEEDFEYFDAFLVPEENDGMTRVGKGGKVIGSTYLIDRWQRGLDAGIYQALVAQANQKVWNMDISSRTALFQRWMHDAFLEHISALQDLNQQYLSRYERLSNSKSEKSNDIIASKRIIGCTTTAAAKYATQLAHARPGIVLVEEAGEILESHILTSLSQNTKQLIMIGDHQQLRPKVANYALSVEKNDGYDLNKSLFERLVTSGFPHVTLTKQHRMRPEISELVRRLMYPKLEDDISTLNRPDLRGLQSNVVFFNHPHAETGTREIADRRDGGASVSKENLFEAEMVLKIVRYLAQQGYGTENQVVLTPYLGQLRLLFNTLKLENDPVLNDLDSFDLVKAGLMPASGSGTGGRTLRMSTIDNYQGEESDIVIVSLTRGNSQGDIGFMSQPQRLNVLLSRARNGLIMIGNASTFVASRKGNSTWEPFFDHLKERGFLYDGFPIQCERHPKKMALLKTKEAFDVECPDGGCNEPCNARLSCTKHVCPQRCHNVVDHSKMKCVHIMEDKCIQGHKMTWECWKQSVPCRTCEAEILGKEKVKQRDHQLATTRQAKQMEYARKLAELDDEIQHQRRIQKDRLDELEQVTNLERKRKDLAAAKKIAGNAFKDQMHKTELPTRSDSKEGEEVIPAEEMEIDLRDSAQAEWEHQKRFENADNEHIDNLIGMIGLETVKQAVLGIKAKVDTCVRQGASLENERFGAVLLGNPGTGKTTVARLYAKCLASMGVIPGSSIKETTGSRLASDGVQACKKLIEDVLQDGGGSIFIDEAYQLTTGSSFGGTSVLDFLLAEVENLTGKIVFILAGYNKQMETFFAHNQGLPSRFPCELRFDDYDDRELLKILGRLIDERFKGNMSVEGGIEGLYSRIASRRVGHGRGRDGFGNARAIEIAFSRILARQSKRLTRQRRAGQQTDDFLLTKQDMIGPEPAEVLANNSTWEKLKSLTGLESVKESVNALFQSISYNYERELDEQPLLQFNLNKVFLGSPGTGKTTVAKLYGRILADMGLLSNGEVIIKTPADFVGDVLGASEKTTKGILESTKGKVLVIDEAYGLYASQGDIYKTAVIDTIVAEVQSVPGDDRCVLILGYKDQMETMLQNVNPGLSRRFPISEAFVFEDFSDDQLETILLSKLRQQAYNATSRALTAAMECLKRARNRPNFGNAGEVDILLNGAKLRHQQRRSKGLMKDATTLEAVDIDPEYDRGEGSATNIGMLFKDVVGMDDLVGQLEGYQRTVRNMKARGIDPHDQIPFNFLFSGPPGTGKTTTARKMGKLYFDMGFLATAEVIESSATDMVGGFVGQTGGKTRQLLEKALGRVLFIDEAYRLAQGEFAKEAMDEMVDCLTKPAFAGKIVVILAGYDADISRLMSINPGLTSRFPENITFPALKPKDCLRLYASLLLKKKHLDCKLLQDLPESVAQTLLDRFDRLGELPNWANARDVGTLAKSTYGRLMREADTDSSAAIEVDEGTMIEVIDAMIQDRETRARHTSPLALCNEDLPPRVQVAPQSSRGTSTTIKTTADRNLSTPVRETPPVDCEVIPEEATESSLAEKRDNNVDDATWQSLQHAKQLAIDHERQYQKMLALKSAAEVEDVEQERKVEELKDQEAQLQQNLEQSDEDLEARRRLEQERIERELARRKRQEEYEKLKTMIEERQREMRKEQAAQRKLREMGVCPVGYRWIKQSGGYRCAGGSHWVSDHQLN